MQIADIGSGTGISSELFLKNGYFVTGVEPNKEMREKSEMLLKEYPRFSAIDGSAEGTNLAAQSIDCIVAGQAFHWFDRYETNIEFKRILKSPGLVVLIWNERLVNTPFEKEYEALIIKHGREYQTIDHRNIDETAIQSFFAPHTVHFKNFANQQIFDYNGLEGRLRSSSYMPNTSEPGFDTMIADLKYLFDQYQQDGHITIHYDTRVYTCRINTFP